MITASQIFTREPLAKSFLLCYNGCNKKTPRAGACGSCEVVWIYGFGGLTTILTIYGSGLRGKYGLCGTKKHCFRTKKHRKALKKRQKIGISLFGSTMPQVRILSLRPYRVFITDVRNTRYFFACVYLIFDSFEQIRLLFFICLVILRLGDIR